MDGYLKNALQKTNILNRDRNNLLISEQHVSTEIDPMIEPIATEQKCKVCPNFKTLKMNELTDHIKSEHKFQCRHCPIYFTHKQTLVTHMELLHDKKYYDKTPKTPQKIERESSKLSYVTRGAGTIFKCSRCAIYFSQKRKLVKHMEIAHNKMIVYKNDKEVIVDKVSDKDAVEEGDAKFSDNLSHKVFS